MLFTVAALVAEADGATVGTWSTAAPYPLFVSEHNATVVENRIYVAGGFAGSDRNFSGTTDAFHVCDPSAGRWTALAPLPKKLHHFGIATLGNKIYVTGGYTDEDFALDNKAVYVFDPQEPGGGNWTPIADLPAERAAHVSVAAGGLLYVVGGVGHDAAALWAYHPAKAIPPARRWPRTKSTIRPPIPGPRCPPCRPPATASLRAWSTAAGTSSAAGCWRAAEPSLR